MILDFTKLHNVLERIAVALEGGAETAVGAVEGAVKRGRGRPAKGEGAVSDPSLAAAAAPAASTAAIAAVTTAPVPNGAEGVGPVTITVTLQKVADAIIDLANNYSRDTAVAILKANGAGKVPELKPESYAKVLAETLTAIAAAKAVKDASLV